MNKTFRRYARVDGKICRRLGFYVVRWRMFAHTRSEDGRAQFALSIDNETNPLDHDKYHLLNEADLREATMRLLSLESAPKAMLERIRDGDTDACGDCTHCQQFIISHSDDAVEYEALYNPERHRFEGMATVKCANPEVYDQKEIVWKLHFYVVTRFGRDNPRAYMYVASVSPTHPHVGGGVCMDRTAADQATTLLKAREWADGLRVLLEAVRYINPNSVVTHGLEFHLRIRHCPVCRRFKKISSMRTCRVCKRPMCPDCAQKKLKKDLCRACHSNSLIESSKQNDFDWTTEGIPREPHSFGDVKVGSVVILGAHDNEEWWMPSMHAYVGRMAVITALHDHYSGHTHAHVNVDGGRWCWRLENMQLGIPKEKK